MFHSLWKALAGRRASLTLLAVGTVAPAALLAQPPPPPEPPLGSIVPGSAPVGGSNDSGGASSFGEAVPPPPPFPPAFSEGPSGGPASSGFEGLPGSSGGDFPGQGLGYPATPSFGGFSSGFGGGFGGGSFGKPMVPNIQMTLEQRSGREGDCPTLLQLTDARAPGGFEGEGDAPLQWIAEVGFAVRSRTRDKVVWEAPLHSRYEKCDGRASIGRIDGVLASRAPSHVSLEFAKGMVRLTVDLRRRPMQGKIVAAEVEGNGRPVWRYVLSRGEQSRAADRAAARGTARR